MKETEFREIKVPRVKRKGDQNKEGEYKKIGKKTKDEDEEEKIIRGGAEEKMVAGGGERGEEIRKKK